jgi:hypothetical protein
MNSAILQKQAAKSRVVIKQYRRDNAASIATINVKCDIANVCRCVDKEFAFTANYTKGHGHTFHDWMRRYHPGELMMPVIRTLGGDRQDSSFEGALQVYMGRKFFMQWLHEELCSSSKENILQTNMFIILRSVEMTAQLHIASIVFREVIGNACT